MNKITDKTTINTENNTISLSHNKSQQPQIFHFLPLKPCFVRSLFVLSSLFGTIIRRSNEAEASEKRFG